jgi:hypothetical protein
MKSENFKTRFSRNAMPVLVALVVMALILVTVPLTSTPAKVFGGYGWKNYMSGPLSQWIRYASFKVPVSGAGSSGPAVAASNNSEPTLATVAIYAVAIQGNDVDSSAFTLDGVPAASWALSGDGDLVLNFKLGGLYAAGDVVTLNGKYKDGTAFTVDVTIQ